MNDSPPPADATDPQASVWPAGLTPHPDQMTADQRETLAERGAEALDAALGKIDFIRYLQLTGSRTDHDYTRDRWRWLGGESNDELLTGAAELLHELGQHELADRVAAFAPAAKAAEEAAWAKEESGDLEGVADRTTAKEAARDAGRAKAAEIAEANRAAAA